MDLNIRALLLGLAFMALMGPCSAQYSGSDSIWVEWTGKGAAVCAEPHIIANLTLKADRFDSLRRAVENIKLGLDRERFSAMAAKRELEDRVSILERELASRDLDYRVAMRQARENRESAVEVLSRYRKEKAKNRLLIGAGLPAIAVLVLFILK